MIKKSYKNFRYINTLNKLFSFLIKHSQILLLLLLLLLLFYIFIKLTNIDEKKYIEKQAYVTLVSDSSYIKGALVLGKSLLNTKTKKDLIVLVTKEINSFEREQLSKIGWKILEVEHISNPVPEKTLKSEWIDTFTKLRVWQIPKEYSKAVQLDADTLVLKNIDELFTQPELSAVYECCDRFNTGVFVYVPSNHTFQDMLNKLTILKSYDGADQGFLNLYFEHKWNKLPFIYNAMQNTYPQTKSWKVEDIKVIHFMGTKPWKEKKEELKDLQQEWENVYQQL